MKSGGLKAFFVFSRPAPDTGNGRSHQRAGEHAVLELSHFARDDVDEANAVSLAHNHHRAARVQSHCVVMLVHDAHHGMVDVNRGGDVPHWLRAGSLQSHLRISRGSVHIGRAKVLVLHTLRLRKPGNRGNDERQNITGIWSGEMDS